MDEYHPLALPVQPYAPTPMQPYTAPTPTQAAPSVQLDSSFPPAFAQELGARAPKISRIQTDAVVMDLNRAAEDDDSFQNEITRLKAELDAELKVLHSTRIDVDAETLQQQEDSLIRKFKAEVTALTKQYDVVQRVMGPRPPPRQPMAPPPANDATTINPSLSISAFASFIQDQAATLASAAQSLNSISQRQMRNIVSGNKMRFTDEGFDLDLVYIDPQIIVMGLPSEGVESMYRNPIDEVVRFFQTKHELSNTKIFNLCTERTYDYKKFHNRVIEYRMPDHEVVRVNTILDFCRNAASWIQDSSDHVVAVHCKGGKGRSGLMVACLMLHLRRFETAKDALLYFARKRTREGSDFVGVEGPSQLRYVQYFEAFSKLGLTMQPSLPRPTVFLTHLTVSPITGATFSPSITITDCVAEVASFKYPELLITDLRSTTIPLRHCAVHGDFKLMVQDMGLLFDGVVFFFYLNTYFLQSDQIRLTKAQLDIACKDIGSTRFPVPFQVVLGCAFQPPTNTRHTPTPAPPVPPRQSKTFSSIDSRIL